HPQRPPGKEAAIVIVATLPFFPVSASDYAERVDLLFAGLMIASFGIILLLVSLILFCVIRYRNGSDVSRAPIRFSTMKMELGWTIPTALIFFGFFLWGAHLYLDRGIPPGEPDRIYVVARQWMWDIRYPDGRRGHNSVHVAEGQPIRLVMTSEDVIHSFFVPALRVKQDVVPGKYVTLSFTATRAGIYPLYCAEYCGTKHSAMLGELVVHTEEDYGRWLARGAPLTSLAEQGRKLFATAGCAGCHSPGAIVHAPQLDGLFGRSVPLAQGTFVTADEQYIHDSILLPMKDLLAGYAPIMPSFQGQLDETEVLALVEYIKTLPPPPAPRDGPQPETLRQKTQ
ncbi:MAG: cytochrome c oxidase subunit II, partial [Verrucomicrobiaceae bacterium]